MNCSLLITRAGSTGWNTGLKDIVVYCSLGFTACGAVFVLSLLGFKNVFMYNGSYVEWAQFKEPVVCQFVEEAPLPRL